MIPNSLNDAMHNTAEPPNKGHVGDNINSCTCFVLCREAVLFSEVVNVLKL